MIKIGFPYLKHTDFKGNKTVINNKGKIVFNGRTMIGTRCTLLKGSGIGNQVVIGANTAKVICTGIHWNE